VVPVSSGLPLEIKRTIQQVAENPGVAVEPQRLEQALLAVMTKISFSYSRQGPLPPPSELAEYERILPGSADRIIASSEKQLNHRIGIERQTIASQNLQSGRGQLFGFIIAVVGFLCSFGAIAMDHAAAGTIIGTVDLVALVSVFVYGKSAQKTNLEKKSKAVPDPGEKQA
jgi:uncharacterized membrane protein